VPNSCTAKKQVLDCSSSIVTNSFTHDASQERSISLSLVRAVSCKRVASCSMVTGIINFSSKCQNITMSAPVLSAEVDQRAGTIIHAQPCPAGYSNLTSTPANRTSMCSLLALECQNMVLVCPASNNMTIVSNPCSLTRATLSNNQQANRSAGFVGYVVDRQSNSMVLRAAR
jgi:hypothetical protein